MTRFLTPSKIGLLCLIELYTEAAVPSSSTIQILSFILKQLLPSTQAKAQHHKRAVSAQQDLPFILDLKSFEALLSAHASASGVPGRTLWDHFLAKLWEIDSLDALHVFFARRASQLAKSREDAAKDAEMGIPRPASAEVMVLSRTSPLGSFVRRAKVEFERLRFGDAQGLWTAFMRWRLETRSYWARRNGMLNRWAGDAALSHGEDIWGAEATEMLELVAYGSLNAGDEEEGRVSTDDVEKLLEFQVEQMQSKSRLPRGSGLWLMIAELGNRIPVEVKENFKDVLDNTIMIPSLSHYLK